MRLSASPSPQFIDVDRKPGLVNTIDPLLTYAMLAILTALNHTADLGRQDLHVGRLKKGGHSGGAGSDR